MTQLGTALLFLLALLGLPLFLVIFGTTLLGQASVGQRAPVMFVEIFDKITDNPIFMTIPLFAHAGFVLSASRAPARLVELSRALLGWLPGGSALVTIVTCALFTAFTGASGVTIIALGGLLLPLLAREGYPERFNLGLLTTGGSLGLLFPPSLPLIIFALIASNIAPVPVETLFLAGIVPGVFLMLVLGLYGGRTCARHSSRESVPFELGRALRAVRAAKLELPIPFLIIGGVFGGYVTISQAAALVAIYVSLVEVYLHRDLTTAQFLRATTQSLVLVGGILMIIMAALAMTNFLTDQEIPRRILGAMDERITNQLTFLLVLNLFLLVVGCLMDIYSAILVVVPLVMPLALRFGIDPVHLGVIFLTNLEIGYSTPPVGINLFISSLRFKRPVVELYRASLPFIGLLLLCLGVITYVPELSLFLVRRVEGTESVELRWARRGASGEEDGLGALRWSLRGPDADPDWELLVEPPPGAPRAEAADLVLRYRPLDLDRLAALQAGEAVRCSFELGRADTEGWQAAARWEDELSAVAELAGRVLEPTEVSVRPAEGRLSELTLGSENWAASAVQIDAVEDGRVRGALRGVVVHFPEDESLPPELYDVEVAFDCTAVLDVLVFEPPGAGARTREIPDVRLLYRVAGGEAEGGRTTFILERTRTRPLHLYVSWSAVLESPEALAGAELTPDQVRVSLEDLDESEFPGESMEVALARLHVDSVGEGELEARLQAVLTGSGGTFDLELPFRLDLRPMEGSGDG